MGDVISTYQTAAFYDGFGFRDAIVRYDEASGALLSQVNLIPYANAGTLGYRGIALGSADYEPVGRFSNSGVAKCDTGYSVFYDGSVPGDEIEDQAVTGAVAGGDLWWVGAHFDPTGTTLIANVVQLQPSGAVGTTYLTTDGDLSRSFGCCADDTGVLYYSPTGTTTLRRLDLTTGTLLSDLTLVPSPAPAGSFSEPCVTRDGSSVVIAAQDTVSGTPGWRIYVFDSAGAQRWQTFFAQGTHTLTPGMVCLSADDLSVYAIWNDGVTGDVFAKTAVTGSGFSFASYDSLLSSRPGGLVAMWLGPPFVPSMRWRTGAVVIC